MSSNMDWIKEKEKIEKLVTDGISYEAIGREYGCTGNNIKKVCKKIGIIVPQRRKINPTETFNKGNGKKCVCENCGKEFEARDSANRKFCSHKCFHEFNSKEYIKRWKNGEVDGLSGDYALSKAVRNYIFEKNDFKCEICGCDLRNPYTGKSILQIHHIDGNCLNNKEENLQLLCPNHHAMTENYGSRNKNGNNGRTKYFKKG